MSLETKELVIAVHIPLSDDYLEEVETAAKVKKPVDSFRDNLAEALGNDGFRLYMTRNTPTPPKAPRAPRSDAGQPRKRVSKAAANGTDTTAAPALA